MWQTCCRQLFKIHILIFVFISFCFAQEERENKNASTVSLKAKRQELKGMLLDFSNEWTTWGLKKWRLSLTVVSFLWLSLSLWILIPNPNFLSFSAMSNSSIHFHLLIDMIIWNHSVLFVVCLILDNCLWYCNKMITIFKCFVCDPVSCTSCLELGWTGGKWLCFRDFFFFKKVSKAYSNNEAQTTNDTKKVYSNNESKNTYILKTN